MLQKFVMAVAASTILAGCLTAEAEPVEVAEAPVGTIVEVAAANEDFSTLVAAVQAAGLVDTLSSEGPFTVFAPTNDAFAALPAGTVESLLLPENVETLTAILTYHVVSGSVMAEDVVALTSGGPVEVATVNGADATVAVTGGAVTIESANVTATDIGASNGVIHVIDAVILPPQ